MATLATSTTSKPAPIPIGAVIGGKYRIEALIAQGGMGLVYRGRHLVLEQPVAIKVVRPELSQKQDAAARFLREARNIASLRSEHVARVLDSGCIRNGPPYMVLELLEGADLRTHLQTQAAPSVERAVDWILQVCEALAEAHAKGLVHRDIKPENLFLTCLPDGRECIKVLDFGISKRFDCAQSTQHVEGQQIGSPHYMAPEQAASPDRVDARADVWSLGVVLFELITGRLPFESRLEALARLNAQPRDVIALREVCPGAPAALERAILMCLAKDAEQRYRSISELSSALAPFGTAAARESDARVRRIAQADLRSGAIASEAPVSFPATTHLDLAPVGRRSIRPLAAALLATVATVATLNWRSVGTAAAYVGASVVTATRGISSGQSVTAAEERPSTIVRAGFVSGTPAPRRAPSPDVHLEIRSARAE